jgi:Tfp pilus assembly protein PilW
MSKALSHSKERSAFTLVEMMISLSVASFILLAVVLATVAFQTVFVATDEYYKAMSDQNRVLDFIAMDMRQVTSGSVSNSGQTLTLNLADYIDYSQTIPAPKTPTISNSTVIYGTAGTQPTAVYTITGTSPNQVITRTYTPTSGASTVSSLTAASAQFQFLIFDPANPGSTAAFSFGGSGQPNSITAQVSFMPRFNRLNLANYRTVAKASATMFLRNHQ